jgi:hypothetical protein
MTFPDSAPVRPLRLAENHFLEVLLSRFDLHREGKGAHLEVSFDSETPACWNRAGRQTLHDHLVKDREKMDRYQRKLDDVLVEACCEEFVFDDPDFVFRWASAGALPVVRLGSEEYYCLFYREIYPIGWNIANGACDSSEELQDPLRTLERELCEELIILDPASMDWYVLDRGDPNSAGRPEYAAVRLAIEEMKRNGTWDQGTTVGQLGTALKWFKGPDMVTINAHGQRHDVGGCYLNINAEDFGIELDRVVKINVGKDAVIFDGEFAGGKLLNRVVGLFRTDSIHRALAGDRFIPDKCFVSGLEKDGSGFERHISGRFIQDIKLTRMPDEVRAYIEEPLKFNLCPVTRRLLQRFSRSVLEQKAATAGFDVFISFGHGDERLANQVAQFITNRCGRSVFYYPRTQTDYDFARAIDHALESAECIVAVGSRLERLTGRWPEYEYRTFNVDVHSGKKPNGKLLSLVMGIDPVDLPLPLRRFVVTSCPNEGELPAALEHLLAYLK